MIKYGLIRRNKLRYKLSKNAREIKLGEVLLVGSLCSGGFIALDKKGQDSYRKIIDSDVDPDNLVESEEEILNNLLAIGIIDSNLIQNKHSKIMAAYFHVTDLCNYNCIGCYSQNYKDLSNGDLSTEECFLVLEKLKELGVETLMISGGEPLTRKDIFKILEYAKCKCDFKVILASNGSMINTDNSKILGKYVDLLKIAIDGYKEDVSYIRPKGSFNSSVNACKIAKEQGINVSFVATLHKLNYNMADEYIDLAKKLGVPITFSVLTCDLNDEIYSKYIMNYDDMKDFISQNSNSDNMEDFPSSNLESLGFKEDCGFGKKLISIASNGDIFPCHMLHFEELKLGNILRLDKNDLSRNFSVRNDRCDSCDYKYICGMGCPARSYLTYRDFNHIDIYCNIYKSQYKEIEEYLNTLIV